MLELTNLIRRLQQQRDPQQLDLFTAVLQTYTDQPGREVSNAAMYEEVVERTGTDGAVLHTQVPVGAKGTLHNIYKRRLRWGQQSLRQAGIIERVDNARGVWRLTTRATRALSRARDDVAAVVFSTDLGVAFLGDCRTVFSRFSEPTTLILTSPPYPIAKGRAYGQFSEEHYTDFICRALEPLLRQLVPGGSVILNLGNDVFEAGLPARSCYREELILALRRRMGLYKIDELIWEVPNKAPGPTRWTGVEKKLLNVGYEPLYHLCNEPLQLRAQNQRVLSSHSARQLALIEAGGEAQHRISADGAHRVRPGSYGHRTAGKIPRNVLRFGHTCHSQRQYKRLARLAGLPCHGAPMPLAVVKFLINYLTEPEELVTDLFGGSLTTAVGAEELGRRWAVSELYLEYLLGGALRFADATGFRFDLLPG